MTLTSRRGKNPNELYDTLIYAQTPEERAQQTVAQKIWGSTPRNLKEVQHAVKPGKTEFRFMEDRENRVEKLIRVLREYHQSLNIYTDAVESSLEALFQGSILTGQQPVIFGGPGFIGNKIALLTRMNEAIRQAHKDHALAPVFFVADYDGLQKELERVYLPNPISGKSMILEIGSALEEPDNVAIHRIKRPTTTWLNEQLQKFLANSREFLAKLKGEQRIRYERTLDSLEVLLRLTYDSSLSLRDWFVKIWAYHVNRGSEHGVIFLPVSHPEVRKLVADQYAPFLQNHHLYTEEMEKITAYLHDLGYYTTVPVRRSHYSPFFYECEKDGERIPLEFNHSKDYNTFMFQGECTICEGHVQLEFKDIYEGLQEIATQISPRVDSSSAVFQELLDVHVRISGPGEIAYYAQVAPSLRHIGFKTPYYVKYKRAFYNSPWLEQLGKTLVTSNKPALHQKPFYRLLGTRAKATQQVKETAVFQIERELKEYIMATYTKLVAAPMKQAVSTYLSWQYGRFEKEKFGQEVSWSWMDMARVTGLNDYLETYRRLYHDVTPFSGMGYMNTQ